MHARLYLAWFIRESGIFLIVKIQFKLSRIHDTIHLQYKELGRSGFCTRRMHWFQDTQVSSKRTTRESASQILSDPIVGLDIYRRLDSDFEIRFGDQVI